jgi:hypothetical protein
VQIRAISLVGVGLLCLAGCVTERAVLTNDQGQTTVCETKGRIGIVSGVILHERHKACLDKAKAQGYTETKTAAPVS